MQYETRERLKKVGIVVEVFTIVVALYFLSTTPNLVANAATGTEAKATQTFEGDAAIGGEWLLRGGMSVTWHYQKVQGPLATDKVTDIPVVNTWGEGRFGWSYDGISSKVKGHGTSCADGHCWEYYYYRYYFKFTRGTKILQQTCYPYVTMTVRGNGTYTAGTGGSGIC